MIIDHPKGQSEAAFILAHGAGAPMDSDFMNQITALLVERNISVVRFEFPYMEERRLTGKKRPPNGQAVLLETWRAVYRQIDEQIRTGDQGWVNQGLPIFIGGKSMGGRMATLVAEELKPSGVIALGYPFHPAGKPEKLRVDHLAEGSVPHLIAQGTRDTLGNIEEVETYSLGNHIELFWLEDGNHDLKPRKLSGFTHDDHMVATCDKILAFMGSVND